MKKPLVDRPVSSPSRRGGTKTGTELPWVLENETSASIFPKGQRPVLELPHSFSFVINISRLVAQPPNTKLTLVPGHDLRRANAVEVAAIQNVLTGYQTVTSWSAWQGGETARNRNGSTSRVPLPADQWRYFVIEFQGSNATIAGIERALCIAPLELKIGFTLLHEALPGTGAPVLLYHVGRLFSQLQSLENTTLPFFDVTSAVAKNIGLLYEQLKNSSQTLVNLARFTQQMLELDALPSTSSLLFLGYFAVLESLLTHQPNPKDTIDSITRQVKRKIILLDNRWQPRIDYSQFPNSTPDKVWSLMYSYRSCLAHGGEPDFKKELQLLLDSGCALKLLRQTVKSILRQALAEPQLIVDLRNC